MTDTLFPDLIDKARHGATWWAGNWQCRNFHGYFQSREGGRGPWRFQIDGFGDDDCTVLVVRDQGSLGTCRAPIDALDRITIMGRKYGRNHWSH